MKNRGKNKSKRRAPIANNDASGSNPSDVPDSDDGSPRCGSLDIQSQCDASQGSQVFKDSQSSAENVDSNPGDMNSSFKESGGEESPENSAQRSSRKRDHAESSYDSDEKDFVAPVLNSAVQTGLTSLTDQLSTLSIDSTRFEPLAESSGVEIATTCYDEMKSLGEGNSATVSIPEETVLPAQVSESSDSESVIEIPFSQCPVQVFELSGDIDNIIETPPSGENIIKMPSSGTAPTFIDKTGGIDYTEYEADAENTTEGSECFSEGASVADTSHYFAYDETKINGREVVDAWVLGRGGSVSTDDELCNMMSQTKGGNALVVYEEPTDSSTEDDTSSSPKAPLSTEDEFFRSFSAPRRSAMAETTTATFEKLQATASVSKVDSFCEKIEHSGVLATATLEDPEVIVIAEECSTCNDDPVRDEDTSSNSVFSPGESFQEEDIPEKSRMGETTNEDLGAITSTVEVDSFCEEGGLISERRSLGETEAVQLKDDIVTHEADTTSLVPETTIEDLPVIQGLAGKEGGALRESLVSPKGGDKGGAYHKIVPADSSDMMDLEENIVEVEIMDDVIESAKDEVMLERLASQEGVASKEGGIMSTGKVTSEDESNSLFVEVGSSCGDLESLSDVTVVDGENGGVAPKEGGVLNESLDVEGLADHSIDYQNVIASIASDEEMSSLATSDAGMSLGDATVSPSEAIAVDTPLEVSSVAENIVAITTDINNSRSSGSFGSPHSSVEDVYESPCAVDKATSGFAAKVIADGEEESTISKQIRFEDLASTFEEFSNDSVHKAEKCRMGPESQEEYSACEQDLVKEKTPSKFTEGEEPVHDATPCKDALIEEKASSINAAPFEKEAPRDDIEINMLKSEEPSEKGATEEALGHDEPKIVIQSDIEAPIQMEALGGADKVNEPVVNMEQGKVLGDVTLGEALGVSAPPVNHSNDIETDDINDTVPLETEAPSQTKALGENGLLLQKEAIEDNSETVTVEQGEPSSEATPAEALFFSEPPVKQSKDIETGDSIITYSVPLETEAPSQAEALVENGLLLQKGAQKDNNEVNAPSVTVEQGEALSDVTPEEALDISAPPVEHSKDSEAVASVITHSAPLESSIPIELHTADEYEIAIEGLGRGQSYNSKMCLSGKGVTHIGKYKFSSSLLSDLGYFKPTEHKHPGFSWQGKWLGKNGVLSMNDFLSTPKVQDLAIREALETCCARISNVLKQHGKDIDQFIGQKCGDVTTTMAGLLTAAHLVAWGSVVKYLEFGADATNSASAAVVENMKRLANE